jgi:hypothetical protein
VIGVFWGQHYHDAKNRRREGDLCAARGRITVHETAISIDLKKD